MFDVTIVGAGSAGLSAALVLGRARRRTLVLDHGDARNAPAAAAHGFFTRDGTPPAVLLAAGRDQLVRYETVEVRPQAAAEIRPIETGFEVVTSDADVMPTRTVLLACGVRDLLPPWAGIEERWGKSVFTCPYCHGWEVRDQPLAVCVSGDVGFEFAALVRGWSRDLVLCSDGPAGMTGEQRVALAERGIAVLEQPIRALAGGGDRLERIEFGDGSTLERRALFLRPAQRPTTDLAARLGCAHTDAGLIAIDESGETSVPGVYAAGDVATKAQQVVRAAASGSAAAAAINHLLAMRDFEACS